MTSQEAAQKYLDDTRAYAAQVCHQAGDNGELVPVTSRETRLVDEFNMQLLKTLMEEPGVSRHGFENQLDFLLQKQGLR